MSRQAKRRRHRHLARGTTATPFTPVPVRARHDGWTPTRQVTFLQVLAQCACVEEACRAVGMSARSAYTLKARPDATSFRDAWEVVLDYALGRLGDALIGRALHGEVTPVFYAGEQVGERRRFDNRLAMWILARRQPDRFGDWRDRTVATRAHADGGAWLMGQAIGRVAADGIAEAQGRPRERWTPLAQMRFADDPAQVELAEALAERRADAAREAEWQTYADTAGRQVGAPWVAEPGKDAPGTS